MESPRVGESESRIGEILQSKEIVKIYEGVHKELDHLSCNLDIVAYELIRERHFEKWKHLTKTILSKVLTNQLTTGILPEVLPLNYVQQISKAQVLDGTIYRNKPEAVFTLEKMTLVGMIRNETSWRHHFVISVPALRLYSTYSRYKGQRVGIQEQRNQL